MRKEYFDRDRQRGLFQTFAWLVEEVGELGEALLKKGTDGVAEELADVIAWTLSLANRLQLLALWHSMRTSTARSRYPLPPLS